MRSLLFVLLLAGTVYGNVLTYEANVSGVPTTIYYPSCTFFCSRLPAVIILQGANVPAESYSLVATKIARLGAIVAVPDAPPIPAGPGIMIKAISPFTVLAVKQQLIDDDATNSPIKGRLRSNSFLLFGHSYGSVVAIIMASHDAATLCQGPLAQLCAGYTEFGPGLKGVIGYGASMVNFDGTRYDTNTTGVPVALIQGSEDGRTTFPNAVLTYYLSLDAPKILFELEGANHYGVTNTQTPPGAIPDPNPQEISQEASTTKIAVLTELLIQADVYDNALVKQLIYRRNRCGLIPVFDAEIDA